MIGAYILAGEIGRHCGSSGGRGGADQSGKDSDGLATALEAYERKLRPFMDRMHKEEEKDLDMMPSTPFGVAIFNSLVGVAAFLRLDVIVMMFHQPGKGLELPKYEEVLRI